MALFVNGKTESAFSNTTYHERFGVGNIQKEIRKFMPNKNIITNIYRIQA